MISSIKKREIEFTFRTDCLVKKRNTCCKESVRLQQKEKGQKKTSLTDWYFNVRLTRFERATPTSAGWCSNPTELQSQII